MASQVDIGKMVSLPASALDARLADLAAELDRRGFRWRELEQA